MLIISVFNEPLLEVRLGTWLAVFIRPNGTESV